MIEHPKEPRIPPLPAAEWRPSARELLATVTVSGAVPNIFSTLVRAEGLTRRLLPFGGKLLNGKLPRRDREILVLRTAWNCQADYEWSKHALIALDVGLTQDEVDRVPLGATEEWSKLDSTLLTAADELHTDCCISDTTWALLADHYDTQQLIELPMLVGQYHLIAMTLNSLGVPLDSDDLPHLPR
jgi:alkylhydroperoxidase family enzyme